MFLKHSAAHAIGRTDCYTGIIRTRLSVFMQNGVNINFRCSNRWSSRDWRSR